VSITSPTSGATYTATTSPLTLGGTAADTVSVASVTWTNDRGGGGTATGTTSWTASGIALQAGTNLLTVTARDVGGNTATATLTVMYSPSDTVPGLMAAYAFNEGSGTLVQDVSGNGRHGTVNGATWVTGKWGTDLNFGAYSQYGSLPTSISTGGQFTIALWIKRTDWESSQHHISQRSGPT